MSKILVLGGGIVGLSTAMMLARRGHDVTVFERDSKPLPASPEDAWQGVGKKRRRSVPPASLPTTAQRYKRQDTAHALKEFEIVAA
jgi:glycine/D-amino acid oxidase-like deaminating enzyme